MKEGYIMTVRELRQYLFQIKEQEAEILDLKFSENSPDLIVTIEAEREDIEYTLVYFHYNRQNQKIDR